MRQRRSRRLVTAAQKAIPPAAAAASACAIVVAVVALSMLVAPSPTVFDVVAETERVSMTYRGDRRLPWRWNVEDATIRRGMSEVPFSGSVQLGFPVEVTMERVAHGSLSILIEHETTAEGTCRNATLFGLNEEVWEAVPCRFELLVSDISGRAARGQTTLLTLEGQISAGRPIGFQSQATGTSILRGARITLREKTWLFRSRYDADTRSLGAGDFFQVGEIDQSTRATGVAIMDERPAITAAFRVVGTTATIERPGGGTSELYTDIFTRLRNDRFLQGLAALIGMLVGLMGLCAAIVEGLNGTPSDIAPDGSAAIAGSSMQKDATEGMQTPSRFE